MMGAVVDFQSLPLAGPAPEERERVDAARNRMKILAAAQRLIAEKGIEHVSVDDVAREACVGKGTIYRRFGDRAGLAFALLEQEERVFQDELIRGPAPLGPGAAARERLHAFGERYLEFLDEHADVLAAAEAGPAWLAGAGPRSFYLMHLTVLLREAAPDCDAALGCEHLLHSLSPALFLHLRRRQGVDLGRLKDAWRREVDGWLT